MICTTLEWLKDGPEGAVVYSKLDPVDVGIRKALKDKKRVHTTADRWYVTKL